MKALTLTQPWATLVAIGAKRIETRSWRTQWPKDYRGRLAIHSSKGFPVTCKDLVGQMPFSAVLSPYFRGDAAHVIASLPLGCILATCRVVDCVPTNDLTDLPEQELAFGDFSPGRWGWIIDDVKPLPSPIPAKGALGLWEWEEGKS